MPEGGVIYRAKVCTHPVVVVYHVERLLRPDHEVYAVPVKEGRGKSARIHATLFRGMARCRRFGGLPSGGGVETGVIVATGTAPNVSSWARASA